MALDFQQVREQVKKLGETAPQREQHLKNLRLQARTLLQEKANDPERLRERIQTIVQRYDPSLRCALPLEEPLNGHYPQPAWQVPVTILAADGSQIAPDRHAPVQYCLINIGAICMRVGDGARAPTTRVTSSLFYDQEMYTDTGTITDDRLALLRDANERVSLANLAAETIAAGLPGPVVSFTDGPLELWGRKDDASEFMEQLVVYTGVLRELCQLGAITAGYVDKPAADLVVRLLETSLVTESELSNIRTYFPLRGVRDLDLYREILETGERSAVFAMQSQSAKNYTGELALHFFYLNVGRPGHPWMARVEIPRWVAESQEMLNGLHTALVEQCRIMGNRPYPYLLHRAHETAVVSLDEKDQVTQMILLELRQRGVMVGEESMKQGMKTVVGRTSYKP